MNFTEIMLRNIITKKIKEGGHAPTHIHETEIIFFIAEGKYSASAIFDDLHKGDYFNATMQPSSIEDDVLLQFLTPIQEATDIPLLSWQRVSIKMNHDNKERKAIIYYEEDGKGYSKELDLEI